MRTCAVIPVRNEIGAVGTVVTEARAVCDEVVVVDGGSSDGTAAAAAAAGAHVVHDARSGYGRAVTRGVAAARRGGSGAYLICDGNGSADPTDMRRVLASVVQGRADLALGIRDGGGLRPLQRLGNRMAVEMIARRTGRRFGDVASLRAITAPALSALGNLHQGHGWPVDLLLRAATAGLRVAEWPVHPRPRRGRSKVSGTVRGNLRAGLAFADVLSDAGFARARSAHAPLPTRLHLELTNRCNSVCGICVRTAAPPPAADLSLADIARLLDELPDLESVALQVNGEPLLHRRLPEILDLLAQAGVRAELNTNGLHLDDAMADVLIDGRLAALNVSVDGTVRESYHRLRGVDGLDRVLGNVERFVQRRAARGRGPKVALWMVATRHNLPELPALIEIAGRLGADEVYLQRLVVWGDLEARADNSVHGRLTPALAAALADAEATAARLGVTLVASGGHAPAAMLQPEPQPDPWRTCRRPWQGAVVMADGQLAPCCISTFTAPAASRMGDVRGQGLAVVWNSPGMRQLRTAMLDPAGASPMCEGCGTRWSL